MNNKGIDFHIEAPPNIDLRKFDGYIVDATGYIQKEPNIGHKFIVTEIRPVRRYFVAKK